MGQKRLRIVGIERDGFPGLVGQPNGRAEGRVALAILSLNRRVNGRETVYILFVVIKSTASVQVEIVCEAHVIAKIDAEKIVDLFAVAEFRERRVQKEPVTGVEDIDKAEESRCARVLPWVIAGYLLRSDFAPYFDSDDGFVLDGTRSELPVQFVLQNVTLRRRRDLKLCQVQNPIVFVSYEKPRFPAGVLGAVYRRSEGRTPFE